MPSRRCRLLALRQPALFGHPSSQAYVVFRNLEEAQKACSKDKVSSAAQTAHLVKRHRWCGVRGHRCIANSLSASMPRTSRTVPTPCAQDIFCLKSGDRYVRVSIEQDVSPADLVATDSAASGKVRAHVCLDVGYTAVSCTCTLGRRYESSMHQPRSGHSRAGI